MVPEKFYSVKSLSRIFAVALFFWLLAVATSSYSLMVQLQADSPRKLPFGVFVDQSGQYRVQDFSYNVLYFKGIESGLLSSPYILEDQEKFMRQLVPEAPMGMAHGYSPVAFDLLFPILELPGDEIFMIYLAVGAIGTMLLFCGYLLPKVTDKFQLLALLAGVMGICLTTVFAAGQSALVTTPVLGAFWAVLQRSRTSSGMVDDWLLAVLFWLLCLKPNVAIMPFFLLIGARRWRPLGFGGILLLISWTLTAGYYGGWWNGLRDYLMLMAHYDPSLFPAYLRGGSSSSTPAYGPVTHLLFFINKALFFGVNLALIAGRWRGLVTASEHFQGAIWAFLLFCPYLLGSEYWVVILLIVEGSFFTSGMTWQSLLKLLLLVGLLDLRAGVNTSFDTNLPCKWLLFGWILYEAVSARLKHGARGPELSAAASS